MKAPALAPVLGVLLLNWHASIGSAQEQVYAPARGEYFGLVFTPSEEAHSGSTYLELKLHSLGGVSGRLVIGGRGRSVTGSVLPDGQTTLVLFRGEKGNNSGNGENDWDVKGNAWMQFDLSGSSGAVWGRLVNDPSFTFFGERAGYSRNSPAPQAGKYTMVLPGGDGTSTPTGASFATLDVSMDGTTQIAANLADGRQQKQRVRLTAGGNLPFFMGMYDGDGSLMGNLAMSVETSSNPAGVLLWTRPAEHAPASLPEGWFYAGEVQSSPYRKPAKGEGVLPLTEGEVVLSGADLPEPLQLSFELSGGKVVNTSTGLVLKFIPSTGLFNGSFVHPLSAKKISFKGAVLQEQNCGYGYFLSAEQNSGHVFLGPASTGD